MGSAAPGAFSEKELVQTLLQNQRLLQQSPGTWGRGGHSGRGTSISQVGEQKQHKKTVCGTVAGTDFPDGSGDDDKVAGHNGLGG